MKDKGLGDSIKKITSYFGIEQCDSCKERQNILNKMFPYHIEEDIKIVASKLDKLEDLLKEEPTKQLCNKINDLRASIDGVYVDSCFCNNSSIEVFIESNKNWWHQKKNIK